MNKLRNYDRNYLSIYTVRECAQTMFVQQGEPNNVVDDAIGLPLSQTPACRSVLLPEGSAFSPNRDQDTATSQSNRYIEIIQILDTTITRAWSWVKCDN